MFRNEIIKGAAPREENAPSNSPQKQCNKQSSILAIMKEGKSLNRFEAENIGDHCLHSTISTLRNKGYKFNDEWEYVKTRFGREVHVKRYWYTGAI